MKAIELDDLCADSARILGKLEPGENLVIGNQDRPVAEVQPRHVSSMQPRPCGLYAGQFRVPDDFNDPLPEDILADFGV